MLDAYESDLGWIQEGQTVIFEVEAFPGQSFEGTVAFVDPIVDPRTRTVKVRLDVPNPNHQLKPDMFVRASLYAETTGDAPLTIPASAPLRTGKRAVVYVRVPETDRPTFEGREVVLGLRAGDHYVVESGLAEGELVVVQGNFKIDSEMQIQAKPSMMSPYGGAPVPGHQHGGTEMTAEGGLEADHDALAAKRLGALRNAPPGFSNDLKPLYDAYLELQRALAGDDLERAKQALTPLHGAFADIPEGRAGAKAQDVWNDLVGTVHKTLADAEQKPDLDGLRADFEMLSRVVITLEKAIGPPGGEAHHLAFCPMAFDDDGAYWIQTEEEISNPYFGEMMLRCGTIEETFEGQP
jgi:Cu(I)/Ag(I) efflux system membrane fusion protein